MVIFPKVSDMAPLFLFIIFFLGGGAVSSYSITSQHSATLNHGTSVHCMKMYIMQAFSNANNEESVRLAIEDNDITGRK